MNEQEHDAYIAWCEHANINPDDPRVRELWDERCRAVAEMKAALEGERRRDDY